MRLQLPPLSFLERLVISPSRPHSVIVKVATVSQGNPAARQRRLKGHVITFMHDAPVKVVSVLPVPDHLHRVVSVQFVGPKGTWEKLSKAVCYEEFVLRPDVVYQWLRAWKAVGNPYYAHIEIDDSVQMSEALGQLPQALVDDAVILDDQTTITLNERTAFGVNSAGESLDEDLSSSAEELDQASLLLDHTVVMPFTQLTGDTNRQVSSAICHLSSHIAWRSCQFDTFAPKHAWNVL